MGGLCSSMRSLRMMLVEADMAWISGDISVELGLGYGGGWVCSFIGGGYGVAMV